LQIAQVLDRSAAKREILVTGAQFDAIVIGLGAMGSAASYHLAKRGYRVLGIDRYHPRHANGSFHGQSRIIRKAYLEGSGYVPVVLRAYDLWRELEEETGRDLLTITGGLMLGAPDSLVYSGAKSSAISRGLPYEDMGADDVIARFPGFRPSEDLRAIYEPDAGSLNPEESVTAHLEIAAAHGAELHHGEQVLDWSFDGEGVSVTTDKATYLADRLVIAPGAWAPVLLKELDLPLVIWRTFVGHFDPIAPAAYVPGVCPIYIWEVPEGTYYGFPALPGQGVKVGRHDTGEITTAETIRREITDEDRGVLRAFFERYMPLAAGPIDRMVTCMYTNTPDRHFLIDLHPESDRVVYACGFSGHGFKFSSAIGEALADLVMTGRSTVDVEFLSGKRFQAAAR
jgi:sarcosine oxidase